MNEIIEVAVLFVSFAVFCFIGYKVCDLVFLHWIRLGVDQNAEIVFMFIFGVSSLLFMLLVIDFFYVLTIRWYVWKFIVVMLLLSLLVLIPVFVLFDFSRHLSSIMKRRVMFTIISFVIFVVAFYSLFNPNKEKFSVFYLISLDGMVLRIMFIGIILKAGLSGVSSVLLPFNMLKFLFLNAKNPSESEEELEKRIEVTRRALEERRRQLFSLSETSKNQKVTIGNRMKNLLFKFSSKTALEKNIEALKAEIGTYESLLTFLNLELSSKNAYMNNMKFKKTFLGRLYYLLGFLLALYAIFRIFSSFVRVINIFPSNNANVDDTGNVEDKGNAFQNFIHLVLSFFSENLNVNIMSWGQIISVVLISLLIILSIRSFLLIVIKFLKLTLKFEISSKLIITCFTWIMGVYVLSTILLMRNNLPHEKRVFINAVVQDDTNWDFYTRTYNYLYLLTSGISTIVLVIMNRKN